MSSKGPFSGHIPALDGVRGLAIGLVLWVHFIADFARQEASLLERAFMQVSTYGSFGVDVFFVLSGFLITGILYDTRRTPNFFKNFYMRRTLRIFPLYYGFLVGLFFIARWIPFFQGPAMDEMVARQGWAWAYAINVHIAREGAWSLPYIGHFWSLAVEEHFYLFWPLVVWLFERKTLLKVAAGFVIFATLLRLALSAAGVNDLALYTLTPLRFDALCTGGFLAVMVRGEGTREHWQAWLKKAAWWLLVPSAAFIVVTFGLTRVAEDLVWFFRPLRSTLFSFCFGSILCFALTSPPGSLVGRFFNSRVMTFLGKYSYGLYVFHAVIQYWMMEHKSLEHFEAVIPSHLGAVFAQAVLGVGLSVLVALASYHLYEKRFLGLKVKFEAKPA